MRIYFSYGSVVTVVVLFSALVCFSYVRRGVVVMQKDVERVVEETPAPSDVAPAAMVASMEENIEAPSQIFKPALVSVKLGKEDLKRAQRHVEKQSLLG